MQYTGVNAQSPTVAPLKRIHIVGGPGSGKTTLARTTAAMLNVLPHDLDEVAYEGGAGPKRPLEARKADVQQIARQASWVTEGIYLWWTDDLFRAADAIVWLDVPWRVAAWRIVRRHVSRSLAGDNRHTGMRRLFAFVLASRRYYSSPLSSAPVAPDDDEAITRSVTALELRRYKGKVVRCRKPNDVGGLTAKLQSFVAATP